MQHDEVPVRSIARAIDVLMVLTKEPLSLKSIAEQTGLTKGTCHRLLASLGYRQLVLQDPTTAAYQLGPGCFRLIEALTSASSGISSMAHPHLQQLWQDTGETVTLHVRVGSQRMCIEELPSIHPVRYVAGIGSTAPIHVGSAGKALLAFLSPTEQQQLMDALPLVPLTDQTLTDPDALAEELARIRRDGWAESRGERVVGAAAVSAPILDVDDRAIAAVSVLGPESRLGEPVIIRRVREQLLATATVISTRVFGQPTQNTMRRRANSTTP